ncbi:MAG: flavodoxin family protein [Bacilli bacterium]|nr:flavodoxin family protein [Bacilli bacterium]MBN2695995.1 flavodoxin family protein [Bacilli bacterium]
MNILLLYDSFYGNTLKVAELYDKAFKELEVNVEVKHVNKASFSDLEGRDLLIFGSPTRGFRATKPIVQFLKQAIKNQQKTSFYVYDTRIDPADINSKLLTKMVKAFGYATDQLEKIITKHKCRLLAESDGYVVISSEGPLKDYVEEAVKAKAKELVELLKK